MVVLYITTRTYQPSNFSQADFFDLSNSNMLLRPLFKTLGVSSVFARSLSTNLPVRNAMVAPRPSPKDFAVKDPKVLAKRAQRKKTKHKQPPQLHPLYMDVPRAMKYLRAAEVGQPSKKTTICVQLMVIPEKGSTPLQGKIFFPKPIKDNRVLVFTLADNTRADINRLDESIVVGGTELIQQIQLGELDVTKFNQSYATPEMVSFLKPIARTLGPKGLMPTAKRGTVSDSVVQLLEENFGAFNFKQKGNLLSIPVGRCDFSDDEIIRNIQAASDAVYGCQPPGTKKPNLIGQCFISSTLGPSMVIDFKN